MAHVETTTTGYGKRVSNSFKGIFSGIIAFALGTALLWWNEGRFVKTAKAINEAADNVVSVESVATADPALEGKLIHGTAKALTSEIVSDSAFGISTNAIRIIRNAKFYQWEENSKTETVEKIGGTKETTTTYTYTKKWSDAPVNSQNFRDKDYKNANTTLVSLGDSQKQASSVSWGAYNLPDFLISAVNGEKPLAITLSEATIKEFEAALPKITTAPAAPEAAVVAPTPAAAPAPAEAAPETGPSFAETVGTAPAAPIAPAPVVEAPAAAAPASVWTHVTDNEVYIGRNPASPAIGDVRYTFTYVPTGLEMSIIAQVRGETFVQFKAKNGRTISYTAMGAKTAEEMFDSARASNKTLAIILRVIGVLVVIAGLKAVLGPLSMILAFLPFLRRMVEAGLGILCFLIGLAWSLIVIGLAWLVYRPIIGGALLVAAGALIAASFNRKKKAAQNSAPSA